MSCPMNKPTEKPTYRLTLPSTAEPFAIPMHPGRSSRSLVLGSLDVGTLFLMSALANKYSSLAIQRGAISQPDHAFAIDYSRKNLW